MDQDVIFEKLSGVGGDLAIITLNRAKVLNALNYNMVRTMYDQLQRDMRDPQIKAIIIRAVPGRAFCAGGDLKTTYIQQNETPEANIKFFETEYLLNRLIYHCPKPYIALLDGITMGGGVGISIHGSHRVGSENLIFAMPETTIGFYPDVGGTYFLPRLPDYTGYYAALTGARLSPADCLHLGLITQYIPSDAFADVIHALSQTPMDAENAKPLVDETLKQFCRNPGASEIARSQENIAKVFSQSTVSKIIEEVRTSQDQLLTSSYDQLQKKSPTSLKVTFEALNRARTMDFDACMQQELIMTTHFLNTHDFMEGIRALIVDKDQTPDWQPSTLSEVKDEVVEQYFYEEAHS